MQEVYKAIGRVAPQDVTVLIRGESGTGKELVARALYQHSPRVKGQFLAVNCAAIPDALLESELFGHEKGSFTGADQRRIGKFEQCSGGTLFLDEIGDMSPLVQSKVLRVLQSQQFERVGGNQTITTDVRVIAATNRDLEKMVEEGEFRSDLYYRLSGFTIQLAPLRDRPEDLAPLLENYLAVFSKELSKDVHGISPEAMDVLLELLLARQRPRAAKRAEANAAALGRPRDHSRLHPRPSSLAANRAGGSRRRRRSRHRPAALRRRAARSRLDRSVRRSARVHGALRRDARAPRVRRQPVEGGPHARHHARLPAKQGPRAEGVDRHARASRRRAVGSVKHRRCVKSIAIT